MNATEWRAEARRRYSTAKTAVRVAAEPYNAGEHNALYRLGRISSALCDIGLAIGALDIADKMEAKGE